MARRNMLTSLVKWGITSAVMYGIQKGIRNGTFKRLPQMISNVFNKQTAQQITKPLQNMQGNQTNNQSQSNMQGIPNNFQPVNNTMHKSE